MENLERYLSEHPFFQGLDKPYLELLVGCASNVRFNADQRIIHQGEEANQFYLLRHGKVTVGNTVPGRGFLPLQTLGEGEVLGWSWLMPPYQWRFDARAVELTWRHCPGWQMPADEMRTGSSPGL